MTVWAVCRMPLAAMETSQVVLWCGVLILAIVVLGAGVWVARRFAVKSRPATAAAGWTLDQLRALRAAGQLSESEFEKLKAGVLKSARAGLNEPGRGAQESRGSRQDSAKRRDAGE